MVFLGAFSVQDFGAKDVCIGAWMLSSVGFLRPPQRPGLAAQARIWAIPIVSIVVPFFGLTKYIIRTL